MSVRVFSAVVRPFVAPSASLLNTLIAQDGSNPRTLTGHTKAVTALAILGVGRLVVSASLDGSLRIWNVGTSTCISKIILTQPITALAIGLSPTPSPTPSSTPDLPPHQLALLAHTNGSCSLLSLDHPTSITTLDAGSSPLFAVAYDPATGLVATGARDGTVSLFSLQSWSPSTPTEDLHPISSYRRSTAQITSLGFSGSTLLVGDRKSVV